MKPNLSEFLKLPKDEQRRLLESQCTPEIVHHYEVTCPECGLYYGGHATGCDDICDCHMKPKRTPKKKCEFYNAQFEWKLQDFWIGVFWKRTGGTTDLWICLLPCVPLHVSWGWKHSDQ